jgi:hypothetical protein
MLVMRGSAAGRHAAPRHRRALVLWSLALAVIVVTISLVGARGTFALWNTRSAVGAGTLKSGTATLVVSPMPALRLSALGPGTASAGVFTVGNTGSTALDIRVATTSTKVSYVSPTPDSTVLGALTLHLSSVASSSECTTGRSGAAAPLASFDTGAGYYRLPKGVTATACLEVSLSADAPQSIAGAVVDFTVTVTGTQVAP